MELYVVCVLVVIAMSMLILKGVQLAISIAHPLPNESDLHWRQNPRLPAGGQAGGSPPKVKQKQKQPSSRAPRGKRPPRDIRIEQLYSSSPLSFEELDSSFGRRSGASGGGVGSSGGGGGGNSGHYGSRARTPQSSSRYEVELLNSSGGHVVPGGGGGTGHEVMQMRPGIALEHLSFVEDDLEEDPIEAYVQQQNQRILREHQNRASTPIQSPPPPHNSRSGSSSTTRQYSKSHATIV